MQLAYFRGLGIVVLATAALAASAARTSADDAAGQPSTIQLTAAIDEPDSPAAKRIDIDDAAKAADAAPVEKPKTRVPTPAKRTPSAAPLAKKLAEVKTAPAELDAKKSAGSDAAPVEVEPSANPTPKAEPTAEPPKKTPDAESLQPVPQAQESEPVPVEAASFKSITPGASTKTDVAAAWGEAKDSARKNGDLLELYAVEPFNRVEVGYNGEKVASVVIRLDQAFPAEAVAKQLDLAQIRPVLVFNELGEVLGQSYPERGVLFAFEPSAEPKKASMKVKQIILEPITAEPFVLRAETTLASRPEMSRRDLEQALTLDRTNARAFWLYSRALVAAEKYAKAIVAAAEAVRLDPQNASYRVTRAQILGQIGRLPEAIQEAEKAVETASKRPHVKARALCLQGDLLASGPKPDYRKAIGFHAQAIQTADPLVSDPHPAIRIAAKEVLIDAHLGAAHDIAWGDWKEKEKAVPRWLERAAAVADDLVKNEGASEEQRFRVHARTLAAYVGVRGGISPEAPAKAVLHSGEELIAATPDLDRKAQYQWDLGMALYDAVQICQMRTEADEALKYGERAAEYLERGGEGKPTPTGALLLGRLYFRLGAINSSRGHDHKAAVAWFEKAVPLLDHPLPDEAAADLGRHGETFVSMGVSYWEVGQREKGVSLTEKGIALMERAVKQGSLDRSALVVPYHNLASMQRQLGATDVADRYQEMATRIKSEKLK